MLESMLISEQRQLAVSFLVDVCAMDLDEARQREREVDLANVWESDEDSNGYFEITTDICVTNADKFCRGLRH